MHFNKIAGIELITGVVSNNECYAIKRAETCPEWPFCDAAAQLYERLCLRASKEKRATPHAILNETVTPFAT